MSPSSGEQAYDPKACLIVRLEVRMKLRISTSVIFDVLDFTSSNLATYPGGVPLFNIAQINISVIAGRERNGTPRSSSDWIRERDLMNGQRFVMDTKLNGKVNEYLRCIRAFTGTTDAKRIRISRDIT